MSNKKQLLYKQPNRIFEPIPRIDQLWYSSSKICERTNYIPRQTPRNANRYEWHNAYLTQLIDIYNIIRCIINERYPHKKIKWFSNKAPFHNLSKLIYHCSTKYIEIESKNINPFLKDGQKEREYIKI